MTPTATSNSVIKRCSDCGVAKLPSEFYRRPDRPTSVRSRCKSCHKSAGLIAAREWARRNPRPYVRSEPELARARKWKAEHPERIALQRAAQLRIYRAIKTGKIARPAACERCGKAGVVEAAHSDYAQPMNVRWLCRRCHRMWDHAEPKTLRAAS